MIRGSLMVPLSGEVELPSLLDDVEVPATYGKNYAASYVECGLIELVTFVAREEGR